MIQHTATVGLTTINFLANYPLTFMATVPASKDWEKS